MAHHGKRLASRLKTRLPARLITLDGEFRVILLDLSRTGASVRRDGLRFASGEAILQWMGFETFCIARWNALNQCGLQFDQPIPNEWVLATRQHDATERLPDDEELVRRRAREWVAGLARI
jgi:hypothetical protein